MEVVVFRTTPSPLLHFSIERVEPVKAPYFEAFIFLATMCLWGFAFKKALVWALKVGCSDISHGREVFVTLLRLTEKEGSVKNCLYKVQAQESQGITHSRSIGITQQPNTAKQCIASTLQWMCLTYVARGTALPRRPLQFQRWRSSVVITAVTTPHVL